MNYPMSIEETAHSFVQSGSFPDLKTEEQAKTLLIIGRGFGISDYDSVTGLYMRQGKINMHANVMAAAIKASGKYDYEVTVNSDKECEIHFFRVDATGRFPIGQHRFTMAQAQRANLTKNFTWKQYPEAMLFARCISAGYRAHCPDALGAAPVYVEQHGEMEVDGPAPAPAPQREVPKQEASTIVYEADEPLPVRKALMQDIESWTGEAREECIKKLLNLLEQLGLPTDGTCRDLELGMVLAWVKEVRAKGQDFGDLFDNENFLNMQNSLKTASHQESEEDIDF